MTNNIEQIHAKITKENESNPAESEVDLSNLEVGDWVVCGEKTYTVHSVVITTPEEVVFSVTTTPTTYWSFTRNGFPYNSGNKNITRIFKGTAYMNQTKRAIELQKTPKIDLTTLKVGDRVVWDDQIRTVELIRVAAPHNIWLRFVDDWNFYGFHLNGTPVGENRTGVTGIIKGTYTQPNKPQKTPKIDLTGVDLSSIRDQDSNSEVDLSTLEVGDEVICGGHKKYVADIADIFVDHITLRFSAGLYWSFYLNGKACHSEQDDITKIIKKEQKQKAPFKAFNLKDLKIGATLGAYLNYPASWNEWLIVNLEQVSYKETIVYVTPHTGGGLQDIFRINDKGAMSFFSDKHHVTHATADSIYFEQPETIEKDEPVKYSPYYNVLVREHKI